jgi:hypothetical protein
MRAHRFMGHLAAAAMVLLSLSSRAAAQEVGLDVLSRQVQGYKPAPPQSTLSTGGVNPILLTWSFMGDRFRAFKTVETTKTVDGRPSKIIVFDPSSGISLPEAVRQIESATVSQLRQPQPSPQGICGGTVSDVWDCCYKSVHVDCLLKIRWEDAPNDIMKGYYKLGFGLLTLLDYGKELAKTSQEVAVSDLGKGILLGNTLYFAWPYFADQAATKYLFTVIEDALTARLVTTTGYLLDRLRQANGSPLAGLDAYRCFGKAFEAVQWTGVPNGTNRLQVSTGGPVDVTRPPGSGNYQTTVELYALSGYSYARWVSASTAPIGGSNSPLPKFAQNLSGTIESFPCLGNDTTTAIKQTVNILNTAQSSVWLFQTVWLQAAMSEVLAFQPSTTLNDMTLGRQSLDTIPPQSLAKLLTIYSAMSTRGIAPTVYGPNCRSECAGNTPLCLPVAYVAQNRLRQLRALQAEILKQQPFEITPLRLGQIFDMTNDPTLGLRGSTYVRQNQLMNQGIESVIRAVDETSRNLYLSVPSLLSGTIEFHSPDAFTLKFPVSARRARLQISDAVINDQYGGEISSIYADRSQMIAGTTRGCLLLFYSSQPSISQLASRLAAVFRKSGPRKAPSLMKLISVTTDPKEQTCRLISAGYGGMCSPSDCPPYNFQCGNECATVMGLGPGKLNEAKQRAEIETGVACQ